ncbi:MAG: ATPase [Zetaproteobacteria bacterium]|nr:MAG: ATPase [Zetaproteobacteria bacterium]
MDNHTKTCCPNTSKAKKDWLFIVSASVLILSIGANQILSLLDLSPLLLHHFAQACIQILLTMWWGVALGIVLIGLMSKVPRDFFTAIMGRSDNFSGLLRAVFGGLLLDLCCHGILLVAAKLYERGVSLPQVVAFLVASPWNSLSLTLILITLIGFKWTMLYILGSVIIALITGVILQYLIKTGRLPDNPNKPEMSKNFNFLQESKSLLKTVKFTKSGFSDVLKSGWHDGKMIIKWLLFGTIIAASLRSFVPADVFAEWLGPSVAGLFLTLFIATIVEICSEGSAPVAGEIFTNAHAPGNAFTFLMAGVATDYTELMIVREFTKSWKMAFMIPIITVPQVLFIGWLMNMAGI